MDYIKKILEYTNIFHSSYINEKEMYLKCEHTFDSKLIKNISYIDYEYVCSKCRYSTKYII